MENQKSVAVSLSPSRVYSKTLKHVAVIEDEGQMWLAVLRLNLHSVSTVT